MSDIYVKAWKLLIQRIDSKTGWGKNELKQLMLDCLVEAGNPAEGGKHGE